ncbi:MAG: histidinol-phosphate transaminase [Lachnospiraceae bacterium]|nr:histidinol-phosphate transaminase [Lachnospiraceae bacterium]
MKNFNNNIRKVKPYIPGEQPQEINVIKLNTNENPYPPSPNILEVLKTINDDCLRLYPDPESKILVKALADFYNLNENQVFVGIGSDDVLAMCFLTFFNSLNPIIFPDITYSFYNVWADLFNIPYKYSVLDKNFMIVKEDYFKENGGIIFPNPNAPTGLEMNISDIEDILMHNKDVIVIVDEAYVDFGSHSALPLIKKYKNLIIVQTFSKSRSFAGVRIGYAMGDSELIESLNNVKHSFNSYTINQITLKLGVEVLKNKVYFLDTLKKIESTREWTKKELRKLGFFFQDSKANFIFARHNICPAKELFEALRNQHIYVRHFESARIHDYLRISIGTQKQMETVVSFLKDYLEYR